MRAKTILIVDDDERSRRLLSDVLSAAGYNVVIAETGISAIELVKRRRPPLILLDMRLPDLSGLDVARTIKALPDGIRFTIVAVTANAMAGHAQKVIESGCDAYLSKPINVRDLLTLIGILLSRPAGAKRAEVLPLAGNVRWTAQQKAIVVIAIRGGMIGVREASNRYMLSQTELRQWRNAFDRDGASGLYTVNLNRRTDGE